MKFQLFAFVLVVAGAYAMPSASDVVVVDSPNPERIVVENQIKRIIQHVSQAIRDGGFDPFVIESEEIVFSPVPFLVEVKIFIENLRFAGASDIKIHSLNYNILLSRLRFDISLPQLSLIVGDSGVQGSIFNNKINGQFRGSLSINSIRLSGEVRINLGVISGISLRSVSMDFSLGGIRSDLSLSAQDHDFSEFLNNLLNESIPNALAKNRENINRLLESIVEAIFDRFS